MTESQDPKDKKLSVKARLPRGLADRGFQLAPASALARR